MVKKRVFNDLKLNAQINVYLKKPSLQNHWMAAGKWAGECFFAPIQCARECFSPPIHTLKGHPYHRLRLVLMLMFKGVIGQRPSYACCSRAINGDAQISFSFLSRWEMILVSHVFRENNGVSKNHNFELN